MFDCEFIELSDSQAPPALQGVRLPRQGQRQASPRLPAQAAGRPTTLGSSSQGRDFSPKPVGKAVSSRWAVHAAAAHPGL